MGIYFSKYKYNNITNKIKDENVRELFIKFTYEKKNTWDLYSYNLLNIMIEPNYDIYSISGHSRLCIFQEPYIMLLLVRNESFLTYIEPAWPSTINNIYYCDNDVCDDDCDNDECITIMEFKEVFNLINCIHGDRFPL